MRYVDWLKTAQAIARQAQAVLCAEAGGSHAIMLKGFRNPVTETDQRLNTLIVDALRTAFPTHGILSEESAPDHADAEVVWCVDPLDGTTNFSRGVPLFGVSIAALERGVPVVGVVLDALRDELFAAARGYGATLNGAPLHTSGVAELDAALVAVEWARENTLRRAIWERMGLLLPRVRSLRAFGSAALGMCYVAAGRIDLYYALSLSLWDQAAAALIVQEAGGFIGEIDGGPWTARTVAPLAAASPALAQAALACWASDTPVPVP